MKNTKLTLEKMKLILSLNILVQMKLLKKQDAAKLAEVSVPCFNKYTSLYSLDTETRTITKKENEEN